MIIGLITLDCVSSKNEETATNLTKKQTTLAFVINLNKIKKKVLNKKIFLIHLKQMPSLIKNKYNNKTIYLC
jgi:hypothetical protein